jgi:hypothetical protein
VPPLPVIADTFRVACNWVAGASGQHAVNVMHFYSPAATSADVATAFENHVDHDMWLVCNQNCFIESLSITPLDGLSPTLLHVTDITTNKWGGDATGDPIPQVAALVKLTTSLRGRSYRGRLYLPFVAENKQDSGRLSSSEVASMNTAWAAFIADMLTAGTTLSVASYKHSTRHSALAAVVEIETATQRRRQSRNR